MKRAGAVALSLLSAPLNVHLLKALEDGPLALIDLRRAVGSPPQSTMRVYSRTLVDLGTLERQRQAAFPGTVEYGSTESGNALLGIGAILESGCTKSPDGPDRPGQHRQQERDQGAGRGMVDATSSARSPRNRFPSPTSTG